MEQPRSVGDIFQRHASAIGFGALVLGGLSCVWPVVAIPAFLWSVLATIALTRPMRFAAILGLALSVVGFVLFVVRDAAPAIILSGQRSAEEKAVSRLRELWWAQQKARELGLVKGADGRGQNLFLGELLGADATRGVPTHAPLLRPGTYAPHSPEATSLGVYRAESYLFVVYLPATSGAVTEGQPVDDSAASRRFIAYAWPMGEVLSGSRLFFIDEDERICETDVPPRPAGGVDGLALRPSPFEAFAAPDFASARCPTTGARSWRPWRNKKPRDSSTTSN